MVIFMNNNLKSIRKDWELITSLVDNNKKILDIGCGEGELIKKLQENKNADTRGLEVNGDFVRNALALGLSVVEGNAENDLGQYSDQSFDYVILSQTLQAMYNPKKCFIRNVKSRKQGNCFLPKFWSLEN